MKSLPEHEFWKAISSRLEQYSEEPDDGDWEKITAALPVRSLNARAVNRTADIIAMLIVAFLLGFEVARFTEDKSVIALVPQQKESTERFSGADENGHRIPDEKQQSADPSNSTTLYPPHEDKTGAYQGDTSYHESDAKRKPGNYSGAIKRAPKISLSPGQWLSDDTHANGVQPADAPIEKHGLQQVQRSQIEINLAKDTTGGVDDNGFGHVKSDSTPGKVIDNKSSIITTGEKEEKKKQRKFYPILFAQVNPFLAYQKIIPVTSDDITIQKLNSPGIFSGDRISIGGEIGLQLPVARFLEIYASVGYHHQQTKISYDYLSEEDPAITATQAPLSFDINPSSMTTSYTHRVRGTVMSAGIHYLIRGTHLKHKPGAGVFYMHQLREVNASDGTHHLSGQYVGYQLHYRLEYSLTARAGIYVQPSFRRSIIVPPSTVEPFAIKPYWAGVGVGLVYQF
ncbi:MAG TPA: hypothetical protein VGD40_17760 [Chryseosolibacter sp.]